MNEEHRLAQALTEANRIIERLVNERDAAYERAAKTVESYCGAWDDNGFALATAIRTLKEQA